MHNNSTHSSRLTGEMSNLRYLLLHQVAREDIFQLAEKEITKILADNLLSRFKATAEYNEISADILFETP